MAELHLLLHIFVLVYWLGGDLGAFYASSVVTDPSKPPAARLTAAKIVADVDMAPRMALIFAFPTGLALAISKGWLLWPEWLTPLGYLAGLAWAALAWAIHLKRGPQGLLKPGDLAIRLALAAGLAIGAGASFAGVLALPGFIAIKWVLLALAVLSGLMIRVMLAPFGPAIGALAAGTAGEGEDAAIRDSLGRAKIFVLVIWACVITAAVLGVYTPSL